MSNGLRGVIVCHGRLATALVEAVERISGAHDALVPISNDDCDRESLRQRIAEALGEEPAIVFVDLPSGSCLIAALRELPNEHNARVITGVNLAMLVDFVFHRDLPLDEAAQRLVETGTRSIKVP